MESNKKKALWILVLTWVVIIALFLIVSLMNVGYAMSIELTIVAAIAGLIGAVYTIKLASLKSSK